MRFALLATGSMVALALASYACSSSDDTTPVAADAGKTSSSSSSGKSDDDDDIASSSGETSSGESSSSSSSSSGQSSSSGDAAASSSGSTSGTPFDAGTSGGTPEGQTTAGTKCAGADQPEKTTDNNTVASAVVLTPTTGTATTSFCGSIEGGTDTTDFFTYTFTVPGQFSYAGGASFSATAPTVTIITENVEYPFSSPNIPVKSGTPVLFKITSTTKVDYHISFNVTAN